MPDTQRDEKDWLPACRGKERRKEAVAWVKDGIKMCAFSSMGAREKKKKKTRSSARRGSSHNG